MQVNLGIKSDTNIENYVRKRQNPLLLAKMQILTFQSCLALMSTTLLAYNLILNSYHHSLSNRGQSSSHQVTQRRRKRRVCLLNSFRNCPRLSLAYRMLRGCHRMNRSLLRPKFKENWKPWKHFKVLLFLLLSSIKLLLNP